MRAEKLLKEIAANTKPKLALSEGEKRLISLTQVSVGAAGLAHEWTVPPNVTWRVLTIYQYMIRGGASARELGAAAFPQNNVVGQAFYDVFLGSATIDVSTTVTYAPGLAYVYTAGLPAANIPIPDIIMQEGDGVATYFTGSVAADTCRSSIYVEETKI